MRAAAIAAVLLSVPVCGAVEAAPQFTADAIETEPGHDMRYVRLAFGEKGSRYEYQVSGQPVVQIVKPTEGIALTLFPLTRTYIESKNGLGAVPAGFRPLVACQSSPVVACKKEADASAEGLGAQKIERWTITSMSEPAGMHRWWDPQRKFAVREEFSDGRVMQANMLGTMTFDNRSVENWEFLYLAPNGSYQRGFSLFSPDLGFAIAEKQPGGISRELRNIQPGEPDAKLFEAPEGYKKVDVSPPSPVFPASAPPLRSAEAPFATQPMAVSQPNALIGQIGSMTAPQLQAGQPAMPIGFPPTQTQASSQPVTAPSAFDASPPLPPYNWRLSPGPQAPRPDQQGPGAEPGARP